MSLHSVGSWELLVFTIISSEILTWQRKNKIIFTDSVQVSFIYIAPKYNNSHLEALAEKTPTI